MGYGATCECMVQAAMVILKERERLPGSGGVITPGYAFAKTSLVDRLTSAGGTSGGSSKKSLGRSNSTADG